ncbi:hypothetical protein FVE85_1023 [Porphyridium purpureum]|uniref:Uncharacterized protein n=1 Tax=Porphyridium purpureum TaxID=35688 RepID=A0A5J4Z318_PORPP|nr:hypothetical protein FVE85_1023 [Porphyridium purpureum]|eukprot:POR0729..scf208_2
MYLVHRTNYRGRYVTSRRRDADLRGAIWCQATKGSAGCCLSFGAWRWHVPANVLREYCDDEWFVWMIDLHDGRNPYHYFCKFALVPSKMTAQGHSVVECLEKGWVIVGKVDASSPDMYATLWKLVETYRDRPGCKTHLHVGVVMDEIDTRKCRR